jgi:hypothetical protein
VVLAVAHGQAPLSSLPREHRWIAAHAHRAAGLSTAESAALLACSRSSVLRHRQPPPAGAVA